MMNSGHGLCDADLSVLRPLGEWNARETASPRNQEKIRAWLDHDAGAPGRRVMVLAESYYRYDQRRGVSDGDLQCTDPWAREVERTLRQRKWDAEILQDDRAISPYIEYSPRVGASGFGVPSGIHRESGASSLAFNYAAPLQALDDADFARLKHRTFTWDQQGEEQHRQRLEAVFTGICPIRRRTGDWQLVVPLTSTALGLVGLDQFMILMYDNPEGLQRLMSFLRDDMRMFIRFLEQHRLFDMNNESDYVGAGSVGWTRTLPAADYAGIVRAKDRWGLMESQESVGISPEQYGEFVFPYLKDLAGEFGRIYYGCCEPAHALLHYLRELPGLARVSVSPWADEQKMGDFCRETGVAYSRKPTPNILSAERFDEEAQLRVLEDTVRAAHGCKLEIIQRDVYTTFNQPQRWPKWVQLVRRAAEKWRA